MAFALMKILETRSLKTGVTDEDNKKSKLTFNGDVTDQWIETTATEDFEVYKKVKMSFDDKPKSQWGDAIAKLIIKKGAVIVKPTTSPEIGLRANDFVVAEITPYVPSYEWRNRFVCYLEIYGKMLFTPYRFGSFCDNNFTYEVGKRYTIDNPFFHITGVNIPPSHFLLTREKAEESAGVFSD